MSIQAELTSQNPLHFWKGTAQWPCIMVLLPRCRASDSIARVNSRVTSLRPTLAASPLAMGRTELHGQ